MRKLFASFAIYLIVIPSFGQIQKKVLYGSFVFERQVFQYQYKRDGNIHTLKLSTLAQPDPTADLDSGKLERTELFLKDATKLDSSIKAKDSSDFLKTASPGILDTIAKLPLYIGQLKNIKDSRKIWKEQYESIDKLLEIFDKYKIENIKFADTLVKDIYSVTELLSLYKMFLQNVEQPQTTQEIPFPELKEEEFKEIFRDELGSLYLKNNQPFEKLGEKVNTIAVQIMYEIKARADFKDDEPVTAYMSLKRKYIDVDFEVPARLHQPDTVISHHKKETVIKPYKETKITIKVPFEIKNVTIEFEDGGIKNIFADLLPLVNEYKQIYGSNTIRFRNNKPISIIGKFDPEVFRKQYIFSGNTLELMNNLYEEAKRQSLDTSLFYKEDFDKALSYNAYFVLSNVLDYKVVSETDNEDYSPTNSKIELSEPNSLVELKKEKRSKILTARAYTDFMGLSDDEPNGLVQVEVSKRINIISGRHQGLFLGIGKGNSRGIYTGGFSYFEPRFTVNKIEENNRYLILDSTQLDKVKSLDDSSKHFLINPLEVLRYQQWSFGIDVNIFKLNLLNRKSNFQINGSFNYGRTTAIDSLMVEQKEIIQIQSQNISRISTTSYGVGIMYEVKPDSRYGFSFGYDFRWINTLDKKFEYGNSFTNYFHSSWFNGFLKVNDDSKLFWRFRKNWLSKNDKYNFYQIQLGYELDIFKATE
jgi:hypothetical protein